MAGGRSQAVRRILSWALLALVLAVGIPYVHRHRAEFACLLMVPVSGVVCLVFMALLGRLLEAIVLRMTFKELGADLGIVESNLLTWATGFWNKIPLKPGTGALALYMKRRHAIRYRDYLARLLAVHLVRVLCVGLIGLAVSLPLSINGQLAPAVPVIFAALICGFAIVMAVPSRWEYAGKNFFLRALSQSGHAWHVMRGRHGLLLRIGLWRVGQIGLGVASFLLRCRMVGVQIGVAQAVVVLLLGVVISMVSVVPWDLGVKEAVVGAGMALVGKTFHQGVVVAALARVINVSMMLVLGPLASHRMLARLKPFAQLQDDRDQRDAGLL